MLMRCHGLDHRPLAVDAVMLTARRHGPGPIGSRGAGLPQLSPTLAQVGRLIGTDQRERTHSSRLPPPATRRLSIRPPAGYIKGAPRYSVMASGPP
jgi:hypothetical protein